MNTRSSEPADAVVDAVLSASRVLVAVAARSLAGIGEDVTLAQYRTLVVLASRGPQNLVGLADALAVTPATATRMCDRLVKKGLVVRQSGEGDRRQIRLALSPAGGDLVRAVTDQRRREIESIVSAITPEQQVVLIDALSQFTEAAGEVPEQDWSRGWDL